MAACPKEHDVYDLINDQINKPLIILKRRPGNGAKSSYNGKITEILLYNTMASVPKLSKTFEYKSTFNLLHKKTALESLSHYHWVRFFLSVQTIFQSWNGRRKRERTELNWMFYWLGLGLISVAVSTYGQLHENILFCLLVVFVVSKTYMQTIYVYTYIHTLWYISLYSVYGKYSRISNCESFHDTCRGVSKETYLWQPTRQLIRSWRGSWSIF